MIEPEEIYIIIFVIVALVGAVAFVLGVDYISLYVNGENAYHKEPEYCEQKFIKKYNSVPIESSKNIVGECLYIVHPATKPIRWSELA